MSAWNKGMEGLCEVHGTRERMAHVLEIQHSNGGKKPNAIARQRHPQL